MKESHNDESLDTFIHEMIQASRLGGKKSIFQLLTFPFEYLYLLVQESIPERQNPYVEEEEEVFYRIDRRKDYGLRQAIDDMRFQFNNARLPNTRVITRISDDQVA